MFDYPIFRRTTNSRRGTWWTACSNVLHTMLGLGEGSWESANRLPYFLHGSPLAGAVRAPRWTCGGISGIRRWCAGAGRRAGENKKTHHPSSFFRIRKRKGKKEAFGSRSHSTVVSALSGSPSFPHPVSLRSLIYLAVNSWFVSLGLKPFSSRILSFLMVYSSDL